MSSYFVYNDYFDVKRMCADYGRNYKDMDFEPNPSLVYDEIYWHIDLIDDVLDFINNTELTYAVCEYMDKCRTQL